MTQQSHTSGLPDLSNIKVPAVGQPLAIDQGFVKTALRHLVHKRFGCEVVAAEFDHAVRSISAKIAAPPVDQDELLGYARAIAAVTGYNTRLQITTHDGVEAFATGNRTVVRLPRGLGLGVSEEAPVHPTSMRMALHDIRSAIGLAPEQAVYPATSEKLITLLDQYPELRWTILGDGEILVRNELTVLQQPWFSELLQHLDELQAAAGSELPYRVQLQQGDRELWADLVSEAVRRGIVAPRPWRAEIDHAKGRITAWLENPDEAKDADLPAHIKNRTGYQLHVRKIGSDLHALLDRASLTVPPLDPWDNLRNEIRPEQVESIAGLLPPALEVARIGVQQNVVVAEYLRHETPLSVLRSLVPYLERVGCAVTLVPKPPAQPLPPLAAGPLEQIVERSLPLGILLRSLSVSDKVVAVEVLRAQGSQPKFERWREEFAQFLEPRTLEVKLHQATDEFSERLGRASIEGRRFLGRICDSRGVLVVTKDLDTTLRMVCGVERYETGPHRIEAKERSDLTSMFTLTIDPPETRFREDAVSVERLRNGLRIWVHVVDLAALIPPGSAIEVAARERLVESVSSRRERMPIFNRRFLLEEVSLNKGVVRPALSVRIDVGHDGTILQSSVAPSKIKNDVELTYEEASGERSPARPVSSAAQALVDDVRKAVNAVRVKRGDAPIPPQDSYALVGQLLEISDTIVTNYFRAHELNAISAQPNGQQPRLLRADAEGVVTLRRAGREYRSLVNQQQLYNHLFDLPGLPLEDLERITVDLRDYELTKGARKDEFEAMQRLVAIGPQIGKRADGKLVSLPGGVVGVQVEYAGFYYPGVVVPARRFEAGGIRIGSLNYAPGAVLRGLKIVAADVVKGQLHVELP